MRTYKVTASFSTRCVVEIEAENENEAFEIARNLSGDTFEPSGVDSWEIDSIQEIKQ